MSSSSTTPTSLNIVRSVKDLLATVCHRIISAKTAVEPPSEDEVEALAGMGSTLREESPKVIDMWESWIEGPKGKKVCERGSETSGEADDLCSTCVYR